MNTRFKQRGLTITELLIGVAILAIAIGLAVPTIGEALDRRRLNGAVSDLQARIALARSEAIKRNQAVSVAIVRTDIDDWCLGLKSDDTGGCDCTESDPAEAAFCGFDNDGTVVPQILASNQLTGINMNTTEAAVFGDDLAFAFDPVQGTLTDLADTGSFVIANTTNTYRLQVNVSPLGLTTVCKTAESAVIAGIDTCP